MSLSLSQMLQLLRRNVSSGRSKNVDILNVASQIAREMNAVKFTACKNGRDNTAMAVTLQQVGRGSNMVRGSRFRERGE